MTSRKKMWNSIIIAICLFVLIIPDGILVLIGSDADTIAHVLEFFVYVIIAATVVYGKRVSFPLIIIELIAFRFLYIISDIYNNAPYLSDIVRLLIIVGVVLAIKTLFETGHKMELLKVIYALLSVFIIVNFIYCMIFPSGYVDTRGWDHNYILGQKNRPVYFYLLWFVALGELRCIENKGFKIRDVAISLIEIITEIICGASTGLIVSLVLFLYIIAPKRISEKIAAMIKIKYCIIFTCIMTFLLTSYSVIFQPIVHILFHKSITFSSRDVIWTVAINGIKQNPILGNGNVELPIYWGWEMTQAHNKVLDVLYLGGGVLFIFFILIMLQLSNVVDNCKNKKIVPIIQITAFGYSIVFLMESARYYIIQDITFAILFFSAYEFNSLKKKKMRFRL